MRRIFFPRCELYFVPSGYAPFEASFVAVYDKADTTLFQENGVWQVTDTSVSATTAPMGGFQWLLVRLDIKRRTSFYLVNELLPIGAMGVLNLLVFLLPPESGERVGYSITLLLAIAVFLTIASSSLPKTSFPTISVLCVKLLFDTFVSSLATFFTIIGLRFYHADEDSPVPACLAAMTKVILFRCCCKSGKVKRKRNIPDGVGRNIPYYIENGLKHNGSNGVNNLMKGSHDDEVDIYRDGKLPRIYVDDDVRQEENRNEQITWKDVGKASDVVFFLFTLFAFAISHTAYFMYVNMD